MLPRLVSGIQPTGQLHIGNYFGAVRQMLALQEQYQAFIFVADLHALNQVHDGQTLRANILELLATYLAVGLDPEKVTLFQQSAVPAHAELCVILNSITSMGLLERSHAYKDALANGKLSNVGLFDYPVLMAADILLYQPEVVPVGKDQQQHLEITADIAGRFNHLYGEYFPIPQPLIQPEVATVLGLDGRKMSKSYSNTISLFEEPELLRKKIFSIVTDSRQPSEPKSTDDALFGLHRLLAAPDFAEFEQRYTQGGVGYREAKELLFINMNNFIEPLRARYQQIKSNEKLLTRILEKGNQRANEVANQTLNEIKQRIGVR